MGKYVMKYPNLIVYGGYEIHLGEFRGIDAKGNLEPPRWIFPLSYGLNRTYGHSNNQY